MISFIVCFKESATPVFETATQIFRRPDQGSRSYNTLSIIYATIFTVRASDGSFRVIRLILIGLMRDVLCGQRKVSFWDAHIGKVIR